MTPLPFVSPPGSGISTKRKQTYSQCNVYEMCSHCVTVLCQCVTKIIIMWNLFWHIKMNCFLSHLTLTVSLLLCSHWSRPITSEPAKTKQVWIQTTMPPLGQITIVLQYTFIPFQVCCINVVWSQAGLVCFTFVQSVVSFYTLFFGKICTILRVRLFFSPSVDTFTCEVIVTETLFAIFPSFASIVYWALFKENKHLFKKKSEQLFSVIIEVK